jgi:ceramide glucosyltransferase
MIEFIRYLDKVYCLPWFLIGLWPAWELLRQSAAWRALHAMPRTAVGDDKDENAGRTRFAGVDILQPIRSGDPNLGEALCASLRALAYRGAHLHWLIDEDDPQAANVARAALAGQATLAPRVSITIHPACPSDVNPKLFKLDRALETCCGEAILVLDDDARLPPATLDALLMALSSETSDVSQTPIVATALPAYLPACGLGSRLLARFVNDHAAITYLPPRLKANSPTINGMCWAMRRKRLLDIGGFAPWLKHLTDDLAMAQAVLATGGRIEQRSEPVWMRTDLADVRAYARQMHRWMLFAHLLLRRQPWSARLRIAFGQGLPTLLPMFALLVFAIAPSCFGGALLALGASAHVLGRRVLHRACAGAAASKIEPVSSLSIAFLLPLHAAHAWFDHRIRWRTHRYRVHANDRFEECE